MVMALSLCVFFDYVCKWKNPVKNWSNFKSSCWGTIKIGSPEEIVEMDKSDMSRAEKKELRNEVKEIRQT
jgi:hypothetical protein